MIIPSKVSLPGQGHIPVRKCDYPSEAAHQVIPGISHVREVRVTKGVGFKKAEGSCHHSFSLCQNQFL